LNHRHRRELRLQTLNFGLGSGQSTILTEIGSLPDAKPRLFWEP